LHRRGITEDTFEANSDDITHLLRHTNYQPIRQAISEGKLVKCVNLKGFKGLLNWQTQTDTYFSKEISDRVRVIACLDKLPNIINSDSYENTLSTAEGQKIRKFIGADANDTMVIVWGDEQDAETASNEIQIRAKEATIGIPSETRQALKDGTNGFERILPGPERMYPDTDLPPKIIPDERKKKIKENLPIKFWELEKYFYSLNIPKELVKPLTDSKYSSLAKKIIDEWKIEAKFTSIALVNFVKRLKKKRGDISILTPEIMGSIFKAYKENLIVKDCVFQAMRSAVTNGKFEEECLLKPASDNEIEESIKNALEKYNSMKIINHKNKDKLIIGLVMNELRGRVNGELIAKKIMKINSEKN